MKSKTLLNCFRNYLLIASLSASGLYAQTVTPWLTKGDQSALLAQQSAVSFAANSGTNSSTVTVTPATSYQTMDGFGWTLTDGSAQVISGLAATQQNALLQDLFNPSTGLSSNVVRISIGSSDLSQYTYSYDDTYGDTALANFSLSGFTMDYTVPILKKIIAINPNIKILATPWSAPYWMKSNNGWIGGSLLAANYSAYANYFIKYFQAMGAQGIKIWAITPQNEPENGNNEPSMTFTSAQETDFINNYLGPQMFSAGYGYIKIIGFDHNCNNTAFPTDVANNSSYVDGSAFHLYSGDISAMTTVKNNTGKNVYFTEQFIGGPSNFSGDFGWHMQNVMIGAVNNWGKTAMEWAVATNSSYGPHTSGGCTNCLGAVTITSSTAYTKNTAYYLIGQFSKFVKNGAVRIANTSTSGSIKAASFKNNDGSIVVVLYNTSASAISTKVVSGSNAFTYSVPGTSAVTFKWTDSSTQGFAGYYNILARSTGKGLDVAGAATTGDAVVQQWDITGGGGNNQRWRFESAGNGQYYIRVKSTNLYLALASSSTADGILVKQRSFANNNTFKWTVTSVGSGYYKIENVYSGKALDVKDNSTVNGGVIQVWTYSGGTNEQWTLSQVEAQARPGTGTQDTEEEETLKTLALYPNPAGTNVNIYSDVAGSYTIYSVTGNVVKAGMVAEGGNSIDINTLATGYYLVRYENDKGTTKTFKLLKQ